MGSAHLFTGRFAEHDTIVRALADRYRTQGPPTLLNWALMLLGYSAAAQGRQDHAEQLFDDAVSLPLPEHTFSPNKSIQARTLFRRGDRSRGLRMLRSYVEDLLDSDNMHGACVAAAEYVTMTAKLGRLPEAAQVLHYLEISGLLDTPVWATPGRRREVHDRREPGHADAGSRRPTGTRVHAPDPPRDRAVQQTNCLTVRYIGMMPRANSTR